MTSLNSRNLLFSGLACLSLFGCGGNDGGTATMPTTAEVKEKVSETISEAKDKVNEAKEVVADKVDDAKKAIENIELPKLPEIDSFKGAFSGVMTSLNEALSSVKDSATAEAAAAKIKEMTSKVDSVQGLTSKIPASAKEVVNKYIVQSVNSVKETTSKLLADAKISEKLKPVIDPLMAKLEALTK